MVVELLEDKKLWDQFVEKSPQGLLFHKWEFLKTVERHSKYRLLPYGVYAGDELRCIFPFFLTRGPLGLTHMYSPPPHAQVPYLGPAFDPSLHTGKAHKREKIFKLVIDELCGEIDKIAPDFVDIRIVPKFLDVRPFQWNNFTAHLMFTYAIDLEKPLDDIWASFSKTCRQKIKRVSAHSPEIQQTDDVGPLLDLWLPRFREIGMQAPLLSARYLKELVAAFPKDVTIYDFSIDGRFATASVYCALQKELYCSWIGNVSTRRDLGVDEYLEWEVIRRAKSEGFKTLDLLSAPSQRISEFKSKFNPTIEPYSAVAKVSRLDKIVNLTYQKMRSMLRI